MNSMKLPFNLLSLYATIAFIHLSVVYVYVANSFTLIKVHTFFLLLLAFLMLLIHILGKKTKYNLGYLSLWLFVPKFILAFGFFKLLGDAEQIEKMLKMNFVLAYFLASGLLIYYITKLIK